jgi:hypothetical protein
LFADVGTSLSTRASNLPTNQDDPASALPLACLPALASLLAARRHSARIPGFANADTPG